MTHSIGRILALSIGLMVLACGTVVHAADRSRPIRLIVPFSPGGSNDIMARLFAHQFYESTGQQVIVDNRPGASGIVGTQAAANAAPDGSTLLMMSLTLTVNPSLYRKLPYDTEKDLLPVTLIATAPLMLVVNPRLPVKTVKEFIAYAKANPGKLNFGSGGRGTTPHLAGEMIRTMTGIKMTHVPYKGGGPALTDVMGGQIQFMLENIPSTLPFVQAGRLNALAVTAKKRSPLVPDLPTLDEAGLAGYEIVGWNGLFFPAGTPDENVQMIHEETVKMLARPDVKERLATLGAEGVGSSPAQFAAFVRDEIAKWAQLVKQAGLEPQ